MVEINVEIKLIQSFLMKIRKFHVYNVYRNQSEQEARSVHSLGWTYQPWTALQAGFAL